MASPFSGTAGRLAGMWAANQAQQGLGQITNTFSDAEQRAGGYLTQGYGVGRDVLGTGYADMMDQLGTAYGAAPGQLTAGGDAARTALSDAGSLGIGSIREGRDQALNYGALADYQTQNNYAEAMQRMGQGFDRATGTLQGAAAGYDPLIEQGMRGYNMLGNALGLGGAEGTAAAQGAFQEGPGYQWQVDQATQAAQRAANRTGGLYGGNTLDAVTRVGSNLANQEYGNWIRNLQPYQGAATAAVGGKAGVLGNLSQMQALQGTSMAGLDTAEAAARNEILRNQGNIYTTAGNQIANLQRGTGQDLARLESGLGGSLADLTLREGTDYAKLTGDYASQLAQMGGQYGSSMASLTTGTAGNIASAQQAANNTITQAGTQGLLAGQQASQNQWGAIMGGLGAATKLGGSLLGGGGGGFLSSLFK